MPSRVSTQHATPASGQLAFLRRVTQNDDFRAQLEADPETALAEFGLELDPAEVPARVSLPATETIREGLEYFPPTDPRLPRWVGFLGR